MGVPLTLGFGILFSALSVNGTFVPRYMVSWLYYRVFEYSYRTGCSVFCFFAYWLLLALQRYDTGVDGPS